MYPYLFNYLVQRYYQVITKLLQRCEVVVTSLAVIKTKHVCNHSVIDNQYLCKAIHKTITQLWTKKKQKGFSVSWIIYAWYSLLYLQEQCSSRYANDQPSRSNSNIGVTLKTSFYLFFKQGYYNSRYFSYLCSAQKPWKESPRQSRSPRTGCFFSQ